MLSAWLADKTFQIAVLVLAALSVLVIPASIIQTVRLDGVSVFGWHLVDGAIPARDAARRDLAACHANAATLQGAVAFQNGKIAALGKARMVVQARAAKALADAQEKSREAAVAAQRLLAAKPGRDLCRSADALILEAVK